MRHILNVLNLVEAEVQRRQVELIEVLDVRDEIIVEIELFQRRGDIGWELDAGYFVLAET
jgi:hypothetical protein